MYSISDPLPVPAGIHRYAAHTHCCRSEAHSTIDDYSAELLAQLPPTLILHRHVSLDYKLMAHFVLINWLTQMSYSSKTQAKLAHFTIFEDFWLVRP